MLLFAVVLLALPYAVVLLGGGTVLLAAEIVCFMLLAMAFNVLLGYTGLLSFGHGLFFGLAAYVAALTQIHLFEGSMFLPLVAGTLFSALLGLGIGAVSLRRTGVYFSLLTLAVGQIGFYLVFRSTGLTGGENGLGGFGPVTVLGIDLTNQVNYYYFIAFLVFLSVALLWRFLRSPFGKVLQAVRENQQRAQALGYNTYVVKLVAFTVSSTFAGFAGALYAFLILFAFPQMINATFSGQIVAMTVVGGMGSFFGPAIGAAFFVYFREFLSSFTEHWLVGFGLLFMAFILFSPQGISGLILRLARLLGLRDRSTGEGVMAVAGAGGNGASPPSERDAAQGEEPEAPRLNGWATSVEGRPERALGEEMLLVEGAVKRFGGFAAVDGVDLSVREGEIHGLIGPNGAGKTTFFNCLNGIIPLTAGKVVYRGDEITGKPSYAIASLGMARSFQIVSLFTNLTTFENVRVAVQAVSGHKHDLIGRAEAKSDINDQARRLIGEMGLAGKENVVAGTLSHGDQRLLDITMALATEPDFLLLDEPFAGLPNIERSEISRVVRNLNESRGLTILLIEHDIERVLELSDRMTVLHQGKVLARGAPQEIRSNPEVQRAYMGEERVESVERKDLSAARSLLQLEGVDAFYGKSQALEGVSLEVREGEAVCLLGRNGAGKTTTLSTIMGVIRAQGGRVVFDGEDISRWPIERIARAGIGVTPQGRRIFANLSVRENLTIASREANGDSGWDVDRVYEVFPKLKELERRRAGNLSGGERQMLAIGRALLGNTRLLLLDEPFEGLAQVVIKEVEEVIRELRGQMTILLVEQSAELALSLADRAYVITNGQIVYEGSPEELLRDEEKRNRLVGI